MDYSGTLYGGDQVAPDMRLLPERVRPTRAYEDVLRGDQYDRPVQWSGYHNPYMDEASRKPTVYRLPPEERLAQYLAADAAARIGCGAPAAPAAPPPPAAPAQAFAGQRYLDTVGPPPAWMSGGSNQMMMVVLIVVLVAIFFAMCFRRPAPVYARAPSWDW